MTILGNSINISQRLSPKQAEFLAQCIGCSNVIRNHKIKEFSNVSIDNNQAYSHIKKLKGLDFLKSVPVQILRNASSMAYQDLMSHEKGLRGKPRIKAKHKKRSAIFTNELWSLQSLNDTKTLLTFFNQQGKKGRLPVFSVTLPHSMHQIGKQFRVSRQGKTFTLSYTIEDNIKRPTNEQLLKDLAHLSENELSPMIMGIDRGVKRNAQCSDGKTHAYSKEESDKLKALALKKTKQQRYLAKQKRRNHNESKKCESNRQRQRKTKITTLDKKIAHIRINAVHHWSKQIAETAPNIVAFEKLNLKGMSKRAKPKKDDNGRKYIKNNANAKSGLNRALLNANMGKLGDFTKYKLNLLGKAWVDVHPANTSKIHHVCQTKNTSRPNQATLICHTCKIQENADENASHNIAYKAISVIQSETFLKGKPKSIALRKTVEGEDTSRKKSDSVGITGLKQPVSVCSGKPRTHRHKTSDFEALPLKEHCQEQE